MILIEHLEPTQTPIRYLIHKVANLALIVPLQRLTSLIHILRAKVFRKFAPRTWNLEDTMIENRHGSVQNLFFVCKGNICRSPLAEAYVKSKIKGKNHLRVFSAGLSTTPGHAANALAEAIARQYGLTLDQHRTTPVSREMIQEADLIVVMDYSQRQGLLAMYPEAHGKVVLLSSFSRGIVTHIPDPYGGTIERFDDCYHLISRSCDNLLNYIASLKSPLRGHPAGLFD